MNKYRSAVLALAACAAGLSLAACSSGTPTASSAGTSTPGAGTSSSGASSSSSNASGTSVTTVAPSTGPSIPGRSLTVKMSTGSFPVPAAAKVVENMTGLVVFGSITPTDVSRFYATALPQAGYTVTTNQMLHKGGDTGAYIVFTGHGYKGTVDSLDQFPGTSLAGIGDKNVTTIVFASTK
jgi:hypothetical protein